VQRHINLSSTAFEDLDQNEAWTLTAHAEETVQHYYGTHESISTRQICTYAVTDKVDINIGYI
jgi:hypothetical protein